MNTKIRNVDLNLLKVFDAIYTEESINRAAVRLCVSQPAVSNALRRLRVLYEDELFIRAAKGVTPTPRAHEIAVPVRTALRAIETTLRAEADFTPGTSHRKFTVSLTDYGEMVFLPRIMHEVGRQAPDIDVVCMPDPGASLTLEMKSGNVDLVWDWQRIDDPDYRVDMIFEDHSYCVARRGHPRISGDAVSLELFLELEHVVLRPTRTRVPMIERCLEKLGLERKIMTEASGVLAMAGIVASTDLVACLPNRLARLFAAQLDLCLYPNPVFEETIPVYQMWHRHFDDDAGHRWFRDLCKTVAGRL